MILGIPVTGPEIVTLGVLLWLVTLFQVLVGLRWIKLGRRQYKIHKWVGISILGLAVLHGMAGAAFALGLHIL